jgi:hypothetical protein
MLRDFPSVEFSADGVFQPPPAAVEQVFAIRSSAVPMLRFQVGRALVVFHFFSEEEIECDVAAHEISSQTDLDALLGFVRQLGDVTHKRVVITPENGREHPIISYEPESREFEYHEMAA